MLHDRPTVEIFVVIGESPEGRSQWSDGRKVYGGDCSTREGAEMLKEEAERTGWTRITINSRRKSTY